MKFNHQFPIQIRFNDIDLAGHVYNAVYQEYFDLARISYFKEILNKHLNWDETALVIASIQINFTKPVYLDDTVQIMSKVVALGEKSIEMVQHVVKKGELEPVAVGNSVMVCFDISKKESKPIPVEWRNKLAAFEPGLQIN